MVPQAQNWRQDAAITGRLEARRYVVAAILAASERGFQPRIGPTTGDRHRAHLDTAAKFGEVGSFLECARPGRSNVEAAAALEVPNRVWTTVLAAAEDGRTPGAVPECDHCCKHPQIQLYNPPGLM